MSVAEQPTLAFAASPAERVRRLFESWHGEPAHVCQPLPQSGGSRQYFRVEAPGLSVVGVYGPDERENEAFVSFAKGLREAGANVPEVYVYDAPNKCYLQQDLGAATLYETLVAERAANGGAFTPRLKELYRRTLAALAEMQTRAPKCIDFRKCYPRDAFDEQSMMWDLQYFKYYFLKLAGVAFDEQCLEQDFRTFIDYLGNAGARYFLYRDFQSRNVMVDANDQPWFIDFQGGRRGARQYDVASLLYDGKADIPAPVRNELLAFYVSRLKPAETAAFIRYFYGFVLIRLMQAMGAYGYRGYFERKEHFLKSIPYALDNLREVTLAHTPELDMPELRRVWRELADSRALREVAAGPRLTVEVFSFSYKHGVPVDTSGNGGGYVFDCRALPNPGREARYKHSTGRDTDVRQFFDMHRAEMEPFLEAVRRLVGINVGNYQARGFQHLQVAFGCTGGQHRSVYCAELLAKWLPAAFPGVVVKLTHVEHPEEARK